VPQPGAPPADSGPPSALLGSQWPQPWRVPHPPPSHRTTPPQAPAQRTLRGCSQCPRAAGFPSIAHRTAGLSWIVLVAALPPATARGFQAPAATVVAAGEG